MLGSLGSLNILHYMSFYAVALPSQFCDLVSQGPLCAKTNYVQILQYSKNFNLSHDWQILAYWAMDLLALLFI
jgi:hypothetical protein